MKKSVGEKTIVAEFVRIQIVLNSHESSYDSWKGSVKKIAFGLGLYCCVLLGCDRQPSHGPTLNSHTESTRPSGPTQPERVQEKVAVTTSSGTPFKLILPVVGFANDKGVCRIAVYLGKAHFNDLEYAIAKESTVVVDSKAEAILEFDIPAARDSSEIAVCAYHDENDNSRLDKNSFGIPIERYGFSSNPKRGFGPPKFNEVAIDLNAALLQNESGSKLVIPITIK